jgi:hypothetical protein
MVNPSDSALEGFVANTKTGKKRKFYELLTYYLNPMICAKHFKNAFDYRLRL